MLALFNRLKKESGKSVDELKQAWTRIKKLHARQGYNKGGAKHTQLSFNALKAYAKPAAPAAPEAPAPKRVSRKDSA